MTPQIPSDAPECLQGGKCRPIVCADGHSQRVKHNIFFVDAVFRRHGENLLGNGHTAVCRVGDSALIQRQRYYHAAVFFHQGEDGIHTLPFSAYGVNHSLAVVVAQSDLHSMRIGRVDLQGQIGDRLQLTHSRFEHFRFVDLRQTHVHVQYVNAGFLLPHALTQDVIHISLEESLLEAFLSRGIDPLSNENGTVPKHHRVGVGGYRRDVFIGYRNRGQVCRLFRQSVDVFRRGAAASADHPHTRFYKIRYRFREGLCIHVVYGSPIYHFGQTRIGFENHGNGCAGQKLLHHTLQLIRAERTVGADGVRSHTFQHRRHRGRRGASHQLAVLTVSVGYQNGQIAVFLGRQKGGLRFVGVVHGFNEDQIHAAGGTNPHGFGENLHRILKIQIAQGLQQLSRGADVQSDIFHLIPARGISRGLGIIHRGADDRLQLGLGKFQTVGTEGVGADHVAARVKIIPMDRLYDLGMGDVPSFRMLTGEQSPGLEQGAHATVQTDDILFQKITKVHNCLIFAMFVIPAKAVTDFVGDIIRLSFKDRPIRFGVSNRAIMSFCTLKGRSPYPGLNRGRRDAPISFSISAQNASQSASIRSAPMACSISAREGAIRLYLVISRSMPTPTVAANRITREHPSRLRASWRDERKNTSNSH